MSVRLKRLKADYDKLCTLFSQESRIRIKKTLGDPPEKYQLEYLVSGMEKKIDGSLHLRNNFVVEITLTGAYPRMAPQCKMLTPVFHPNIAPHAVCIGDHWAAGESLANLVVRIAEMLSYQSYNIQSPLNGEAAKWAELKKEILPLDNFDFTSMLAIGEAAGRDAQGALVAAGICANCGKKGGVGEMLACINNHVTCPDCALHCPICHSVVCLKCQLSSCSVCKQSVCQNCSYKCGSCHQVVCANHQDVCHVCQRPRCTDCIVRCVQCGNATCVDHVHKIRNVDGSSQLVCDTCQASL
ncbi:MAG TPA: ubiquitin-conjugating enzyme E2 [Planctomycetota bacterium]|nr:ubiquitin-conjugating enzyme E2 [Planctomycetota bacterium]